MTREEAQKKLRHIEELIKYQNTFNDHLMKLYKTNKSDLEKQLAELEIELYEPHYINCISYGDGSFNKMVDRHNAGEELKKIISEENAKQGWKVDWEDRKQQKYSIWFYSHIYKDIHISDDDMAQTNENEFYFSEQSSKDQDFLDKIKPLWLKWKGIE